MQGHSAANMLPVVASNRIGSEEGETCAIDFYGSSFITDNTGEIVESASTDKEEVLVHEFDLQQNAVDRVGWGMFRDRRPDLYGPLLSLDGQPVRP
jgi:N-carbamoylputrescine amidase